MQELSKQARQVRIAAILACASALFGILLHLLVSGQMAINYRLWTSPADTLSSADDTCKHLWVKNARNDPALDCYLTSHTARLCDPMERNHLALTMYKYRKQSRVYLANAAVSSILPHFIPVAMPGDVLAAQNEAAAAMQGRGAVRPEASAIKKIVDAQAASFERMQPEGHEQAMAVRQLSTEQLVAAIQNIAKQGLVKKQDFGWFAGDLVELGFVGVGQVSSPCRS